MIRDFIESISDKARALRNALGLSLGLITLGTIGATIYVLVDMLNDIESTIAAMQEEDKRMLRDIHQKHLACKDLEIAATIASINSTYTRCK